VKVIKDKVQRVPLTVFEALGAGDLLFLDTSHIAKTGSDVLHEVFEILPHLSPGVLIHFHDIFDGFDYLWEWILDHDRS
jgi:Methyltransferase domain